jgi:hypothetical protein
MQFILWLFLIGGGCWVYTNYEASGHLSGKAYYEACWKYKAGVKGFTDPTPTTPANGSSVSRLRGKRSSTAV